MTHARLFTAAILVMALPPAVLAQKRLPSADLNHFTGAPMAMQAVPNPLTGGSYQPGPKANAMTGAAVGLGGFGAAAQIGMSPVGMSAVPSSPVGMGSSDSALPNAQRNPFTGRATPPSVGYNSLTGGTYRKSVQAVAPGP